MPGSDTPHLNQTVTNPLQTGWNQLTKYQANSTMHVNYEDRLRVEGEDGKGPRVFDTIIPQGNAIAASAEFTGRGTLRQKYVYQGGYEAFRKLAAEIVDAVEDM